jgi:hypothetical protein
MRHIVTLCTLLLTSHPPTWSASALSDMRLKYNSNPPSHSPCIPPARRPALTWLAQVLSPPPPTTPLASLARTRARPQIATSGATEGSWSGSVTSTTSASTPFRSCSSLRFAVRAAAGAGSAAVSGSPCDSYNRIVTYSVSLAGPARWRRGEARRGARGKWKVADKRIQYGAVCVCVGGGPGGSRGAERRTGRPRQADALRPAGEACAK